MTDKLRKENEKRIHQNIEIIAGKIEKLMKMIPEEMYYMKTHAAETLIIESAIWGGMNDYESIGIIEEAKLSFREHSKAVYEREAKKAGESNTDSPGVDRVDEDSSTPQKQEKSNTKKEKA